MVDTTDYEHPEKAFFENPELLGLGRQIGSINYGAFGIFSAKLQHPSWHCESLAHGFEHLLLFYKKLWFSSLKHIYPKYDIGRKEFGKWPSHVRRR